MTVNVQRIWDFKGPLARVSMANLDIEVRDSTRLTRTQQKVIDTLVGKPNPDITSTLSANRNAQTNLSNYDSENDVFFFHSLVIPE